MATTRGRNEPVAFCRPVRARSGLADRRGRRRTLWPHGASDVSLERAVSKSVISGYRLSVTVGGRVRRDEAGRSRRRACPCRDRPYCLGCRLDRARCAVVPCPSATVLEPWSSCGYGPPSRSLPGGCDRGGYRTRWCVCLRTRIRGFLRGSMCGLQPCPIVQSWQEGQSCPRHRDRNGGGGGPAGDHRVACA